MRAALHNTTIHIGCWVSFVSVNHNVTCTQIIGWCIGGLLPFMARHKTTPTLTTQSRSNDILDKVSGFHLKSFFKPWVTAHLNIFIYAFRVNLTPKLKSHPLLFLNVFVIVILRCSFLKNLSTDHVVFENFYHHLGFNFFIGYRVLARHIDVNQNISTAITSAPDLPHTTTTRT